MAHKQGANTCHRYLRSLKDNREVWLSGQKVDVTTHPHFTGILSTLASLYDQQWQPLNVDRMTYQPEPAKPYRASVSYLLPRTHNDLQRKRTNTTIWAYETWGQLARLPDFMSNIVVGLYDFRHHLNKVDTKFHDNVVNYYQHCQQKDTVLTHAIGDPQINRSAGFDQNKATALRVVKEQSDGVVVRGAKQLATLAPVANEVLVYMSPSFAKRECPDYVIWFAIPMATKGLKIVCRKPMTSPDDKTSFLANQFDEQDAMLFFDDVFVPSERIFLLHNAETAHQGFFRINAWALYSNAIRSHQRLSFFAAIAHMLAQSIGVHPFRQIQEKIGELTSYAELLRLSILGMEHDASMTDGGLLAPSDPTAPGVFIAQISLRAYEILREIAASGLIMHPSEADLNAAQLRPFLDRYMCGNEINADTKARLFRLASELAHDAFGSRQELYERWNRGDIARNRAHLYTSTDFSSYIEKILSMIEGPDHTNTQDPPQQTELNHE